MPRTRQIVGLDFGARNVRAVWAQLANGRARATRVETFALPADAPDTPQLVRAWLERTGLARTFGSVALAGGSTVFQPGRLPHTDPRTPQQAAAMDLLQFNEMAGDTMCFDVQAFDPPAEPGHRFYLMAMARPAAIQRALQFAALVGVKPADLVPAPVALYNALEPLAGPHTQPWLYLDVGHNQTDVAIGLPEGLLFARAVPVGGRSFTDAIAQASNLGPAQAEARKHADAGLEASRPFSAPLTVAADRWLAQINSCLGVYRSQFGSGSFVLGQVVLAGGGARLQGLAAYLSAQLKLPAIAAADLPGAATHPDAARWLGQADLAMGLAATALECVPAQLSLLPPTLRNEIVFREKKPFWIAAAVFVALALGVFTASGLAALSGDRQRIQREREELRKCEQLVKRIHEIRDQGDAMRRLARPVMDVLGGGPVAREALTIVANSIHPDDWITLFCDEASYLPQAPEPNPAATAAPPRSPFAFFRDLRAGGSRGKSAAPTAPTRPPGPARPAFIIEGYTPDPSLLSVKELLKRLRTSALVAKADLLADDRVLPPKGLDAAAAAALPPYRRFTIQLEVRVP